MKVWKIDYVKGGEVIKLCNLNEIPPRLYKSAHKVKCNICKKDATHLLTSYPILLGDLIQLPLCADCHKNLTEIK